MILSLSPKGIAWPRDLTSDLGKLAKGFALEPKRLHEKAMRLIDEADPSTTDELLSDWERVTKLPDEGVTEEQSRDERRSTLTSKLTTKGGQQIVKYLELAEKLGYEITITEFRPARCDGPCVGPVCIQQWIFVFEVNAPETTIDYLDCLGECDAPLATWGNQRLEAAIRRKALAHNFVIFTYG